MLSLRDTQAAISAAVRSGDTGAAAPLVVAAGIEPEQRLQIYRNNYCIGAWATLQATYPIVERLGGVDWFRQTAARYQERYPSRSGDLQGLGAGYPAFLRSDLAGTSHVYFADVALLEWAYQLVLTAEERGAMDIGALQAVDPQDYERLQFVPRPAVALVDSPFPIFAIWHANRPGSESDAEIHLDAGASRVLLIRRSDHVELRELSHGSYLLLQQFTLAVPLGAATEMVTAATDQFDLQLCLRELLGLETIATVTLHGAPTDD